METMNARRIQNHGNRGLGGPRSRVPVLRCAISSAALLVLIAATALSGVSQSNPDLQTYFQQDIGLSQDQIAAIRNGHPVTKALPSRTPAEVFLFGAIYIHAAPEKYVGFALSFNRLATLSNPFVSGRFSPP